MDLSIFERDELELLEVLITGTKNGRVSWELDEYNPISLFDSGTMGDEKHEYMLVQMFTLLAEIGKLNFCVEFSESINVATGKGDLFLTAFQESPDGYKVVNASLSGDLSYDKLSVEDVQKEYSNHPAVRLADAILDKINDASKISKAYKWAAFTNQDIPDEIRELPLSRIGKEIFCQQYALGFHRCVLDAVYDGGDTKFPFPSVWLRNLHSSDWGRGIFSLPDSFYQFVVIPPQPWQRRFDSHPIDSRRSLVCLYSFVSPVQVVPVQYLT